MHAVSGFELRDAELAGRTSHRSDAPPDIFSDANWNDDCERFSREIHLGI
jgi:hypothetical protein